MDYILEINDLCKEYNNSKFKLKDISFSVPYGSIMGFVGENGAGKTSTMNIILNILRSDSGTVRLFGKEMKDGDVDLREDIGVVFDSCNFSENLNIVSLSKVMSGIYKHWNNGMYFDYMEKFHLPLKQKIKSFSRGMSMKLSIAVALSHGSKLLVLDEATSGLDPIVRDEILDVFLDFIQNEKHSILLSSHITSDLEKIADYITFIHNGEILLTEKKDDLLYNYGIIRCKSSQLEMIDKKDIIAYRNKDYQTDVLIHDKSSAVKKYKNYIIDNTTIDEIMLIIAKGENNERFIA